MAVKSWETALAATVTTEPASPATPGPGRGRHCQLAGMDAHPLEHWWSAPPQADERGPVPPAQAKQRKQHSPRDIDERDAR